MKVTKITLYIIQIILWSLFLYAPFTGNNPMRFFDWNSKLVFIINHLNFFILFYINYFYLIPYILNKKGLKKYVLALSVLVLSVYAFINIVKAILFKNFVYTEHATESIVPIIQVLAVSIAFRLILNQIENAVNKKILEEEKTKAELMYLRSQINPHFLYNTLNNIAALVHINQHKAESSIIKLSKIMRSMLGHEINEKVKLSTELELINTYIDLQKLRLNEDTILNYTLEGEAADVDIEPLILINFIENAFKHGVGIERTEIDIKIIISQNFLSLYTKNGLSYFDKDDTTGIGLENVKKRLDILYKDNYTLKTETINSEFILNLNLNL